MRSILILIVLLIGIIFGAYYWISGKILSFPKLKTGLYSGIFEIKGNKKLKFFLFSDSASDFLIQFSDEVNSINLGKVDFEAEQSNSVLRLRLASQLYELTGDCKDHEECSGSIEQEDQFVGSWKLTKAQNLSAINGEERLENFNRYYELKLQNAEITNQIQSAEQELKELKEEYQQYEDLVTAGSGLKEISDNKYAEIQEDLVNLEREVREKKQNLSEMQAKLSVALRLTSLGKIVSLARESLQIESDLILKAKELTKIQSPEVQQKLNEGERILNIKKQLNAEKNRIDELKRQ